MAHFDISASPPLDFSIPAYWFLFQGKRLLVFSGESQGKEGVTIPLTTHPKIPQIPLKRFHFLGNLAGIPCYVGEVGEGGEPPPGYTSHGLRGLFGRLDDNFMRIAGRAAHILDWDRNHQFCGRCGAKTELSQDRALVCPTCGLRAYPRISPAVIMAVVREDQLLLGHAQRHPEGFYSVLAGFAEPGETLEEAVAREVREEVGLEIKNTRYFGSQPWPFPDSLMIGFTCEYAAGEIELVDSELDDAGWYRPGNYPGMVPPAEISIAGQLIEWFAGRFPNGSTS